MGAFDEFIAGLLIHTIHHEKILGRAHGRAA
jgi:hypothetical protein